MTTPERNYSVLEKKLKELEALLAAETIHSLLNHEEIQARLGFLKMIMSSEMKLNAGVPPERLQYMADKLEELDDAYQNSVGESVVLSDEYNPDHDIHSSCSCTSSCLNEEDIEGSLIVPDGVTAVNSIGDEDGGAGKGYLEEEEKEVEAEEQSAVTRMNDLILNFHEREEEREEENESKNFEEVVASPEESRSRSNEDVQMMLQEASVLQNAEGFECRGAKSGKKCSFLARTVMAAAAAVIAIAATKLWPEEEIYFVPT